MQAPHAPLAPQDHTGFTVAIICALELEADAVLDTFDIKWDDQGYRYGRAPQDNNIYTTGVVGGHNVVLAHMPGMGVTNASTVAANLRHSFPNVKLALIVGVCGGVPYSQHHNRGIFLGDLIVSTAVVQYDFGRQYPSALERKATLEDNLGRPSHEIRAFLAKLKTQHFSRKIQDRILTCLERARDQYPGRDQDILYEATHLHKHRSTGEDTTCEECVAHSQQICDAAKKTPCQELGCGVDRQIHRSRRHDDKSLPSHCPTIHFGRIGSGNGVIKSGQHRDQIAKDDSIIAFEMESAGTWDHIPSIVVKGVCDYADSHKSKGWQRYAAVVAANGAAAMLHEWESDQDKVEGSLQPELSHVIRHKTSRWHMPFARDPDFVPRNDITEQIHQIFQNTEYSPRVVLTGVGGVGKSQIAIEYAYQIRERVPNVSVFWVYASTLARFRASFESLARELELPGLEDPTVDQVDRVYQWLQSGRDSGNWLLVLDNVDDISLLSSSRSADDENISIARYLPQRADGAILVTTRDRRVAVRLASRLEYTISVSNMSNDEADALLLSKIPSDPASDTERAMLLKSLDYLPLAITQTAAYIARRQRMNIKHYVELFTGRIANQIRLLTEEESDLRRSWDVPHSVLRTWEISFAQIRLQSPVAAEMLSLIAVLDRQAIPDFLLRMDYDTMQFEDAIETLLGYAFIEVETNGSVFKTHRLIQLATQAWLSSQHRWTAYQEQALVLLNRHYPVGKYENWAKCQILEPHAEYILQAEYQTDDNELQLASVLYKRAWYWSEKGDYKRAYNFANESTRKYTEKLGEHHLDTLMSMNELGLILVAQGQYIAAEQMYRHTLAIEEIVLGREHPDILTTMHNLANVLDKQGQYTAAEQIFRQTLAIKERVLEREHPDTLTTMDNLASVLIKQGQYTAAEQIYRQTLAAKEKVLGHEHPDTLMTMSNLAPILIKQGQYTAAEQICRQTLAAMEKVLGHEHPDTLTTMDNLASVLIKQGQYTAAEQIYRQTLAGKGKVLGLGHPDTCLSAWGLASLLWQIGSKQESCHFYERACTGFASLLGENHPDTQACRQQYERVRASEAGTSSQS